MSGPSGRAGLRVYAVVSPRRDGRVRAIPIILKLMTSICIYCPVAALVQAADYLPSLPARSQEHLLPAN